MPHSILMLHHPSGTSRGQASEMHIESRELVRVRDYLSLVTSEATGQPYDRVIRELSRWAAGQVPVPVPVPVTVAVPVGYQYRTLV